MVTNLNQEKQQIAYGYDQTAREYREFADRLVYTFLDEPLAAALRDAGGVVLDVASGTGALGRQLPEAVAVDLSHGQLLSSDLVARVQGDAEHLPFPDDSFAAAGCAFGINHFPNPKAAVAEMARVAPVVGLLTWVRPEQTYAPKEVVLNVVERHAGTPKTDSGKMIDHMGEAVGSEAALGDILSYCRLTADVSTIEIEVPWPGAENYVDYRLSASGAERLVSYVALLRREAIEKIKNLEPEQLPWRPQLVLGIGRR